MVFENKRAQIGEKGKALCPYCLDGWIIRERASGLFRCKVCNRVVEMEEG